MSHYRWRDRYPGSAWNHAEACDANTIKARIPQGVMLEIESEMHPDRWIEVADISERVVGSGNSIEVVGPNGKVYASVLAASQAVGIKYAAIRRLVDGRHDGWGRA